MFGTALDQNTGQVQSLPLSTVAQIIIQWKATSSIILRSLLKSPLFLRLASAAGTVAPPAARRNVNGCLMLTESCDRSWKSEIEILTCSIFIFLSGLGASFLLLWLGGHPTRYIM